MCVFFPLGGVFVVRLRANGGGGGGGDVGAVGSMSGRYTAAVAAAASRLGLRNQLRALLWLDVSLSFVPR